MNTPPRVVVAVIGDKGVGKTSLITTAAQEVYSEHPPPVVPPTRFPPDFHSEPTELLVFDTSSRPEDQKQTDETIRSADAVILCFDAMRRTTLERLRTFWLPELQRLKPGVPIVVACCKHDDEDIVPYDEIRAVRNRSRQVKATGPQRSLSLADAKGASSSTASGAFSMH